MCMYMYVYVYVYVYVFESVCLSMCWLDRVDGESLAEMFSQKEQNYSAVASHVYRVGDWLILPWDNLLLELGSLNEYHASLTAELYEWPPY